jgi:ubiquinone/menaquinone biosynthesis C-methylase UbiE
MNAFDMVAREFERHRALPAHVPAAIRKVLQEQASVAPTARMLEIGCGAGRIGAAFALSGDNYLGLDLSLAMLRQFERKACGRKSDLVCADASLMPFCDGTFALVLLVHLSAAERGHSLLMEALRVLDAGGVVAVGSIMAPQGGVDARMRTRLNELLAAAGVDRGAGKRHAADDWLADLCSERREVVAAQWTAARSPRDFILRKRSAAPFATVPADVRESVLASLAAWAEESIGPLSTPHTETHRFSLKLYWFGEAASHG